MSQCQYFHARVHLLRFLSSIWLWLIPLLPVHRSTELSECLSKRRLIVVGDSTSKALWGMLAQMADGIIGTEWSHSLSIVKRNLANGGKFEVYAIYHSPLQETESFPHRPYSSRSHAMNALEFVWNAAGPTPPGVKDVLLVGSHASSWVNDVGKWVQVRDEIEETLEAKLPNDVTNNPFFEWSAIENDHKFVPEFEWMGNGSCVDKNSKDQYSRCVDSIESCKQLCLEKQKTCSGIAYFPNKSCSSASRESSNCKVFTMSNLFVTAKEDPSLELQQCFSHHPRSQVPVRKFPHDVPVIIRSNSPNFIHHHSYNPSLETEQWNTTEISRLRTQKLATTLGKHNVYYFDLFHRLNTFMKDGLFRDEVHWDSSFGRTGDAVNGHIAQDVANDFASLFCRL
jgi:hypothetical protein